MSAVGRWRTWWAGAACLFLVSPSLCRADATALRAPVTEYPPYEYTDAGGYAAGIVPTLLREIGRRLGRTVEFVPCSARAAQRGLQVGRFDLHVAARAEDEVRDVVYMPQVLYHYRQVVLSAPDDLSTISSLADLTESKVAVATHDVSELLLRRHPRVERITVPDYETGMRLVADGHALYFVGNHDVCLHLINAGRAPNLKPVLTNILATPAVVVMSPKSEPKLIEDVRNVLEEMVDDGSLSRLTATWLGGEFTAPVTPPWIVRYLKPVLYTTGGLLLLLLCFVVLLRSVVKARTRSLLEAQESLRRSEARYRQVFNTASEAILIIDLEGVIQACSDHVQDIHMYRPSELVGRHASLFLPEAARHVLEEDIAYLCDHGQRLHEQEHLRRDGKLIQVELSERVILWEKDPVIVRCVRDISQQRHAEEELRKSHEQLERAQRVEMAAMIAGQIAHDFNNLLSPLLGLPELIRQELPEGSPAHRDLTLIHMSATRLGEISQQLLTLGRRGHYNQTPLDLNRVVADALEALQGRVSEDIRVQSRLTSEPLTIVGGNVQLLRVISNILWNAVEAIEDTGEIRVRTGSTWLQGRLGDHDSVKAGTYARLTIEDTGCGIPEDIRTRIFEPFFSTKQTSRQRGQGLGLSVVHGVVEDHGGYIDLHTQPGHGSRFDIYFPLRQEAILATEETGTLHGTERILVVDDDDLQVEVFARILTSLGYDVAGVQSGEAAVEYVRSHPVDLLVLDMVMENGMGGAETLKHVKDIRPELDAVLVSGYAESSAVAAARKLGASRLLRKPVTREALAGAIRALLDQTPA